LDVLLFGGRVRFLLMGRRYGDFHPKAPGATSRRQSVLRGLGADRCFSPKPGFTIRIVWADALVGTYSDESDPAFVRTCESADAGITLDAVTAISFWNADCPIGVLFHEPTGMTVAVHLGFRNLFRENDVPTTLEAAIKTIAVDPGELSFWSGGGIDTCCFGYSDNSLISGLRSAFGEKASPGSVERGPRRGQYAVDLNYMINVVAERAGLDCDANRGPKICTSCFGLTDLADNGWGAYWSTVREPHGMPEPRPRNGAFVLRRDPIKA